MTEPVIHQVTCTDFQIDHRRAGTIARCTCGWVDQWNMQGGNAEASGADHMRMNNPKPEAGTDVSIKIADVPDRQQDQRRQTVLVYDRTHGHNCSCHISPPCNQCVNCKHPDEPDCDNDCQNCDIDHDV